MAILSALLGLFSIAVFLILAFGLIKPSWMRVASRLQVLKRMGIAFLVFVLALFIGPTPPTTNAPVVKVENPPAISAEQENEKLRRELEQAKLDAQKAKDEATRLEAENAKAEADRLEAEKAKAEADRLEAEKAKAEADKLEAEKAKATALVPVIDITKLASASKTTISKLLGETTGCEPSKYGEKCTYEKLGTEIVYVKDKANFITLNNLRTVDYDAQAIEYLGLKPAEPDSVGAESLLWTNQQGLLETNVFKGGEGKVFYAYIKAFADYDEAEAITQGKPAPKTDKIAENSPSTHKSEDTNCGATDLNCWGNEFSMTHAGSCKRLIESMAKYDYKWTDGWLGMKFEAFRWKSKKKDTVTIVGNQLQMQNGFGAFQRVNYECDIRVSNKEVTDVRVTPYE